MKKKMVLILLILIPLVLSQEIIQEENELKVRFHSTGQNATINLKQYLGTGFYYYSGSIYTKIILDQEKGTALIIPKPDFEGVEEISFKVNKTILKPTILIKKENIISDTEIVNSIKNSNLNPEYLIARFDKQKLTSVNSKIEDNFLKVDVNDEVELSFDLKQRKPSVSFNILNLQKTTTPEISTFDYSFIKYIVIILIILTAFYFIKDKIIFKKAVDIKSGFITKLDKIHLSKKNSKLKLEKLIKQFFITFLNIKPKNIYDLKEILDRRHIKGDLKQKILFLYKIPVEYKNFKKIKDLLKMIIKEI